MSAAKILIPIAMLLPAAATITPAASASPILQTNHGCYLVGQPVQITGSGFAPTRTYQVTVDGIDFGTSTTDSTGAFTAALRPGGLGANVVQAVHVLDATDGTSDTRIKFTVTRPAGARVIAGPGPPATLRAPFQVWGFGLGGVPLGATSIQLPVYVHYVGPHRRLRKTISLGHTRGQCGYLKTKARRLFPFIPARGNWTLQIDTSHAYSKHPLAPAAKIRVTVT